MGRHRRSAAGSAAGSHHADGTAARRDEPPASHADERPSAGIAPYPNPEAYAEVRAKSDAYLFALDDPSDAGHPGTGRTVPSPGDGFVPDGGPRQRAGSRRRRARRAATPVRTGLLGVSAAVALGTVAVATGVVPGLDSYRIGGAADGGGRVETADVPANSPAGLGGASGSAETGHDADAPTSRGTAGRSPSSSASSSSPSASASPSPSASKPTSAAPSGTPSTAEPESSAPARKQQSSPSRTATKTPEQKAGASTTVSGQAVAAAQVVKLVNDERAKAGCSPVAANSALSELAADYSQAMAEQGFFDHTDPSGATPWDRAEAAGISDLGGENIARGQADAQAVMDAWMDSPGHRANILNCDFRTLGVGVHFGPGGPWWTQNFGY
ncbi:CAP domain-containing protein [Streptomyces sp. NPDC006367]|uniref:CAP domain-containing protein n=1 Tax=unclassified Streptomyces TaxID=2593676 RepID=UPI0033B141DF